jgi:hypothetical protein
MDRNGKSDPYFIVYTDLTSANRRELYKSEIVSEDLNPNWKPSNLCVPFLE